jgi:hypothetical protein
VEKQVLMAFCTFERYNRQQNSYDGHIFTYSESGEFERGAIFVQVKATDKLRHSKKHSGYEVRIDTRDLTLWAEEALPILLVLYDAENDVGYFTEMGEYFDKNRHLLKDIHKFRRIFIPIENLFKLEAVKKYQILKNQSYAINKQF